jgi:dolichyl-diphosphooligosaccharide--protein glycosyltransferase
MVHNFPAYPWYDPMTAYPVGKTLDWGPLMAFVASGLSLLSGMTTRPEMMYVASWVPPIFAALTVPVTYLVGKHLWDYKVGLVAAGLITIVSLLYVIVSAFGNLDHHAAETLFSTMFCLMYIITLQFAQKNISDIKNSPKSVQFALLVLATAAFYFLGFLNMPTIILFGLIVAIYTFIQIVLDVAKNNPVTYIVTCNIAVFSIVAILEAAFGVKTGGLALQQYSLGQILAMLFIVAETAVMYVIAKVFGNKKQNFIIAIILCIAAVVAVTHLVTGGRFFSELLVFFGQNTATSAIKEALPWSLPVAFYSFNLALVLFAIGFIVFLWQIYRNCRPEHLFFLIWTVIILFSTIQHLRYEYYLAVNVALLSAFGIVEGIRYGQKLLDSDRTGLLEGGGRTIKKDAPPPEPPEKSKKKREKSKRPDPDKKSQGHSKKQVAGYVIIIGVLLLTGYTIVASLQTDIRYVTTPVTIIDQSWVESMEWISEYTPDPGVEYLKVYDKDNFTYPPQSYGIMAWWDNGHYITFIGKRIPITNPFQDNLAGPGGAASFFIAGSEDEALSILQNLGGRYVVTDTNTATEIFGGIIQWYDPKSNSLSYIRTFFKQDTNGLMQINGELEPYYRTAVVRLQLYDGSMIVPGNVIYLEYINQNKGGLAYPIITAARIIPADEAAQAVAQFKSQPGEQKNAIRIGQFLQPLEKVPAMRQFRLVHESQGKSPDLDIYDVSGVNSISRIKIFEAVPGARVRGNGTIEVQILTDAGRTFVYQQESINGEFIVPYSTNGNPYTVKTVGKYHIVGTDIEFDVSEEDVLLGNTVEI